MRSQKPYSIVLFLSLSLLAASGYAADPADIPKRFVKNLYQLHKDMVSTHDIRTESENGGYGGVRGDPNFYKEIRYLDKKSGRLLSMIQWENQTPDNIHSIEVYIYDQSGRVVRDYAATYLPYSRNAPFQTLIGLHHYEDALASSRQYDAGGEVLSEDCSGKLSGKKFRIVLEDYEIPDNPKTIEDPAERAAYPVCFDKLPKHPGKYLDPLVEITTK